MTNNLAIIDYGIGGFDLFKMIKSNFPEFPILYFSDSGYIPYGKVRKIDLKKRIYKVFEFLKSKGITHVVVACHAASTVADSYESLHILNMIDSTLNSLKNHDCSSIGIIGGGRTINSRIYRNALKDSISDIYQRNAQPLSIIIESGAKDKSYLHYQLKKILNPIKNVDTLLLACTHYPAIKNDIAQIMKNNCLLIDPMNDVYKKLYGILNPNQTGQDSIYTTGDPKLMRIASLNAFNVKIKDVLKIELE